jgi:photosystem II stability/assembly factor-like uncharacterized protein
MSRSTIGLSALALAMFAVSVRAQSLTEPDPGLLVDFASLGDASEVEPLDRMAAQRALRGEYQNEDFKRNAIAELARKRALYASQAAGASAPAGVPVWKSIGPTRDRFLQNGVTLTKVIDSGRVANVLAAGDDANTVYVLTSGGGLWKTDRFAEDEASWVPLTDDLVTTSGGSFALGRARGSIYLGIGDSFDVEGLIAGVMVKSRDGGKTWDPIVNLPGASAVRDVKVDTILRTEVVLVATDAGVFRSIDGGASYALTLPGGAWSLVKSSAGWLASTMGTAGNSPLFGDGHLYFSGDAGATWSRINAGLDGNYPLNSGAGRMTLATAKPGDAIVYALAGSPQGDRQADLYRSADGGMTWSALHVNDSKVPTNPNCYQPTMDLLGGQAYYNQAIVVDPSDAARKTVYIGGQLSSAKSTDGGQSWQLISNWLPGSCPDGSNANSPYIHADFHTATIVRSDDGLSVLVFGTDGGLAVSKNGGRSFSTATNRNLVTHLTQTVVSSPNSKSKFGALSGLQDDGTRLRVNAGGVWNQVIGGDGEGVGWSQANNAVAIGSVYSSDIRRYENLPANPAPVNWARATTGISGLDYYPFYTPIATPTAVADPTGLTFFTSTGLKVYRTVDGAKTWQPIFNSYPNQSFNLSHNVIGVDPANVNRVAVAGTGGRAFLTTDGGTTWSVKPLKALAAGYPGINISPSWGPNNTLYMASSYAGLGRPRMVRSSDGGVTWALASGGLPDVLLNQVLADPRDATGNTAYSATQLGVYVTRNGGANWSLLGAGLPNVWVMGLYISPDGKLQAASYGRGVWEIQL